MTKLSKEEKQSWAVGQLKDMCERLGRLPKKSDFDAATLSRIKAFLGSWPQALAFAKLTPQREQKEKNKP